MQQNQVCTYKQNGKHADIFPSNSVLSKLKQTHQTIFTSELFCVLPAPFQELQKLVRETCTWLQLGAYLTDAKVYVLHSCTYMKTSVSHFLLFWIFSRFWFLCRERMVIQMSVGCCCTVKFVQSLQTRKDVNLLRSVSL